MTHRDPPSWPPPDSWIREALAESDESSREERVERFRLLAELFPPSGGLLILGGVPAWFALEDAQRSFLSGDFLAVVLCAQTLAEHSLASHYVLSGDDKTAESGLAGLVDRARADGLIDSTFSTQLHKLRRMRNPYTHPHAGLNPRSYMTRLVASGHANPHALVAADARLALEVVAKFIDAGRSK